MLRGSLTLLCFLGGLALGCTLLAKVAPFPKVGSVSKKLRAFPERYADSEVIFVGSSRVLHQVIPEEFDAAVQAAGYPMRSFNFGQAGTWPPESFYVTRQILKLDAPRLKWIFIELMSIDAVMLFQNDETAQARYWHDRHHTNLAERELFSLDQPPGFKLQMLGRHELLWLRQSTNYGSGEPLLRNALSLEKERSEPRTMAERAGFLPGPTRALEGEDRTIFLEGLAKTRDGLARQAASLSPALRAELHTLIAEIRAKGVEPVFFISPGLNPSMNYAEVPDGARLISFCRPDLYPELYQPEYYYNRVHLNPKGAEVYTSLLAQKYVELCAEKRTDQPRRGP
ncbi:MAG TPA: hypothetical protein VGO11_02855 [Chthoniobacteraceae bacterium]|nr:hypothetical protein [Chthoniobacteraceae bacterium]